MTWFKVDDGLAFHHKIVKAGNAAMGLWVRAGSYASATLTDGFVPDHMVALLGTPAQRRKLVAAGLWIEGDGGVWFHEWAENGRQPTAQSVRADRAKNAARQQRHRNKKSGKYTEDPQVGEVRNAVTEASVTGEVTGGVTTAPTRPVLNTPSSPPPGDESELPLGVETGPATEPKPEPKPDPLDGFADFYAAYPRREDRGTAERAWRAARKRGVTPEHMTTAARSYAARCREAGTERRFIKLPASWLNAKAYDNEQRTEAASANPATFDELRDGADAVAAARLIRGVYVETPRPPGDPTPQLEWARCEAIAYIDAHADAIREALGERRAG